MLPEFHDEDEERRFWAKADSTKYINWSSAKQWTFVNLKLSAKADRSTLKRAPR
jgi:CopG antitoxin of type II toxin-antitoxin system